MNQPIILVIDDELDLRISVEKALKYEPYELVFADNGKEGLERFYEYSPLMVLLDLRMPVMDGFEVLKQLRVSSEAPYLVIVLTGHGEDEAVQQCFELGIHTFIRKPFNIFELQGTIKQSILLKQTQIVLKQSEQAEREQQKRMYQFLDAIPTGIFVIDDKGNPYFSNETAKNILGKGIDPTDALGKLTEIYQVYRVGTDEIYPVQETPIVRALTKGESSYIDDMEIHKEGKVIPIEVHGVPVYDQQNKIAFAIATFQDITERLLVEEKLKQARDYLDTVLFNLPIGVAILEGPEFRYFRINQTLANLNGIAVEDHLGKTLAEVLPHAKEMIIPELRHLLETGEPILHREFSIQLPKNPDRPVHLIDWHIPIQGKDINSTAIVSVVLDVTELKETQERLRQSQKLEALGILAGGIAHDFNNILASILGNTELLSRKLPKDHPGVRHLENISKGGERATNLVQQILTFSRMETTRLKPVNLSSVVEDALKMARATIPANIEISQTLEKDFPYILADVTQMHQIVLNLCTNAYHAMEETGGTIIVHLSKLDYCPPNLCVGNGTCLRLTVQDTGCGITPKNQEKIFDPFFTTKEVGKGTGLGLSVVHGIVEKHQGKIEVQSEVGKGTTISIYFPITEKSAPEKESTEGIQDQKGSNHILIVEDEPELVQLYQEFLEQQGYLVTACGNGSDALTLFKENPNQFDLVLTDQAMPNMTGKQLSQSLLSIRPDLPILLSTRYSDVITSDEAQELGIRLYLKKPIKLSQLQQAIAGCLK